MKTPQSTSHSLPPSLPLRKQIGLGLRVRYRREILGVDGRRVWRSKWDNNLILDSGLDKIGSGLICDAFTFGVIGTGTDPVQRDSGAITISIASGVATASAGFFEAGDVGRLLRLNSGEQGYISAFNSTTSVDVSAPDAAAAEGAVFYVNRTQLQTEHKRTSGYRTESGDNSSTWNNTLKTWTHRRTYLFSAEAGTVTIQEVGWSNGGNPTTLFGIDVLGGGGDTLLAGQQYVITVEVIVAWSPGTPAAVGNVGTGMDTSGDAGLACLSSQVISIIAASGATTGSTGTAQGEPAGNVTGNAGMMVAASEAFTAPTATNGTINPPAGDEVNGSKAGYSAGTFVRDWSATFSVSQANYDIHGLCARRGGGASMFFGQLFTAPQTKLATQTLTVGIRWSWDRVFS